MNKLEQTNYLTCCTLNCKIKHNEHDTVVQINIRDLDDVNQDQNNEENELQEFSEQQNNTIRYSINLDQQICTNKFTKFNSIVKTKQSVALYIEGIDSQNISKVFWILKGDNIHCIQLTFIEIFSKYKYNYIIDVFNAVQQLKNLESLMIQNQDTLVKQNPKRLQKSLISALRQGSLSKLKRLRITSTLMQMNCQTLENLEKIMINNDKDSLGMLTEFSFSATECEIDTKSFECINRILYYNRKSLQYLKIQLLEENFVENNPLNSIGKSIAEMDQLRSISLQLILIQSEFEQVNTNLSKFFEGISKNRSEVLLDIQIGFQNVYAMSCSNIGNALSRIKNISYFGPISHPQAVEMGIALGKSNNLNDLKIISSCDNLGLMLSYLFHFSKTLKTVQVDYQGKRLLVFKEIQAGLSANQSLEQFVLSSSDALKYNTKALYHLGKGIGNNKSLKKVILILGDCQGDFEWFHKFFDEISESQTLQLLNFDYQSEKRYDKFDPQRIIQSINKIKSLQTLEFQFNTYILKVLFKLFYLYHIYNIPFFIQKKKDKILFIKLLQGILNHQYAFNFCMNDNIKDLRNIQVKLNLECENLILKQIIFNKVIGPLLLYNPTRHIEDLYFS